MQPETGPITPEQFDAAMTAFSRVELGRTGMAVAVSGGGDSLALALLLQGWAQQHGSRLLALTVDHGLRPESAAEAQAVQDQLAARGMAHRILRWDGEKPVTHVQERAREARYRLLSTCCRAENIDVLAVAHHREDQIETFWMRLAHGSGLDGLAGMAPHVTRDDGLHVIRPLLGFSRESLRETCRHYGVQWVEDPSNAQQRYLRPRLRAFEEALAAEGLSPERLAQTLQKLEEARQALQQVTASVFHDGALLHDAGYITLERDKWRSHPRDIRRRMLALALEKLSPGLYPPARESLDSLMAAILREDFGGQTLRGCDIAPLGKDRLLLCREEGAMAGPQPACDGACWDGRFTVRGTGGESLTIAGLGEAGIAALRHNLSKDHPALQQLEALPFKVRKTLPILRHDGNIVFIQHLDYIVPEYAARLSALHLDPVAA